jgi:hypothetical protein
VSHGAGAVRENDDRRGRASDAARERTSTAVGSRSRRRPPFCLRKVRGHPSTRISLSSAERERENRAPSNPISSATTTTMVDQSLVEDNNNNNDFNHGRRPQVSIDLQIGNHLRSAHPSPIRADQVVLVPSLFGSDLSVTTYHDLREELVPLLRVKYRRRSDLNKSKRNSICSSNKNDEEEEDGTAAGWLLDLARTEGGGILVAPRSLGAAALARIIATASAGGPEGSAPSRTITTTTSGTARSVAAADAAADVIDAVFNTGEDDEDDDEDDEEAVELRADRTATENAPAAIPRPVVPSSSSSISSSLQCRAVAEVVRRLCQYYSIDPHTALVNVGIFVGRPRTHHVQARPAQSYVPVRPPLLSCFVVFLVSDVVRSHLSHLHARAQTQH